MGNTILPLAHEHLLHCVQEQNYTDSKALLSRLVERSLATADTAALRSEPPLSHTWWVVSKRLRYRTEWERGPCVHGLPPQKQQNSQKMHSHLGLSCCPFCQPTSTHGSKHLLGREFYLVTISEHEGKKDFPHQLEVLCSGNLKQNLKTDFATQKVLNPSTCLADTVGRAASMELLAYTSLL